MTNQDVPLGDDRIFKDKDAPEEVAEFALDDDDPVWLPGLLKDAGLVSSTSEGKRMIAQGAVKLDGERVEEERVARPDLSGRVVQVGKRRFVKLLPAGDVPPPGT